MNNRAEWKNAAIVFRDGSDGKRNRTVISEICQHIADSDALSGELKVDPSRSPNSVLISKANGSFSTKTLRIESIDGDRLEVCLSDSRNGKERYYFPHTPAEKGFDRVLQIIEHLNWREDVKQYRNPLDWMLSMFGRPTPNS